MLLVEMLALVLCAIAFIGMIGMWVGTIYYDFYKDREVKDKEGINKHEEL